uniref:Uncharacterized protein n=1 Tax=Hyaloperonospora arabidopsidis (strain Emoy2) TaxID=559515 RepID=M4B2T6_HYAAE
MLPSVSSTLPSISLQFCRAVSGGNIRTSTSQQEWMQRPQPPLGFNSSADDDWYGQASHKAFWCALRQLIVLGLILPI